MKPQTLYRIVADAEAVTWALLILGMILKYTDVTEVGVTIAGPLHGLAFLTFVTVTALVWVNNRWSAARGLTGLASSVIPFCTIPFERNCYRTGHLDGSWREDNPVLAPVTRNPKATTGVLAGVIIVVFAVLMLIGGPFG
ncbi:DUF3817 domain-containing protein [Corynebacterium terpenotabidum]|uniref:DUF3817 domain-containing protein n=1 Tax=Corynebacterium terpenotabidum Y-11 TaxID=1200352 RepID=S4XGU5_9CORY|nr:DUF3817 domain-containing protein [Corynebacterium terpenotabidum]AGP30875.1 hypothetical protein A606_06140 [Corynebacterium terpenotabidum Y-11]